jgi:ATP-binding cassette subfamily F protein 3
MIIAEKIYKSFGPQVVLKDISLTLRPKERIGVVGVNGAGKSTLVKILAGIVEPDKGTVNHHGSSVGYLSQESQCRLGVTIGEEMRSAFPGVEDIEARLLKASHAVSDDGGSKFDMAELARAADDLTRLDAHTIEARIGRVLSGLGFELDAVDRLTDTYSGGWQMRIAMAKLLLQEPEYLFLDEPTNHLDDAARWWLISYIAEYPGTVVMISHEPEFLNMTCERILEVEDAQVKIYTGNFDDYERLKQEAYEREVQEFESQQKEIAEWKEFIQRWRGHKSKAGMVEDREKKLAKLDIKARPKARPRSMYLQLPEPPRSPNEPVIIERMTKKYGDKTIWNDVSLTLERGDKIALVGPNGVGKSTLLRMVAGVEGPTSGKIEVNPKTVSAYFAQHQAEALNPNLTILQETLYGLDHQQEEMARNLLARLLFRGEDVFKEIKVLSGGERSRVALAKFLMRPANLYLLDEPTNHLDQISRGVLQEALQRFEGTVLMASHDQPFIDSVATGIFRVEEGKLIMEKDPVIARIAED